MARYPLIRRVGAMTTLMLIAGAPLLVGQGCPGSSGITPIVPGDGSGGTGGDPADVPGTGRITPGDANPATGNTPPFLEFLRPTNDISREIGDVITLQWEDIDPDDDAAITLIVDPDAVFDNGTEIVVEPGISENAEDSGDLYRLDTGAIDLEPGIYRIIASVDDGVNAEYIAVAPGLLHLFGTGILPGTRSPVVAVTEPAVNRGVGQGETIPIEWCVSDPDDGEDDNGDLVLPEIIVLLDLDDDPTNDLDLSDVDAETLVEEVCAAAELPTPIIVNGQIRAYVIGCDEDVEGGALGDCADPAANATLFPPNGEYAIDASKIPPRIDGEPYHVRVTTWDYNNPPVHDYAPGTVSVTSSASGGAGVIDLVQVGRTISGTRCIGFDPGAQAGATGLGIGDFDADGADDFIIVARLGRPFERGNVGSAFLVYGTVGEKFAGEINLNSVGTDYRGAGFAMARKPDAAVSSGIAVVARIDDLTGDDRPEILFGLPYVEQLYDYWDDDPSDDDDVCYGDLFPNPLSDSDPGNDDLSGFDGGHFDAAFNFVLREVQGCSNDGTIATPAFTADLQIDGATSINQGYVLYVESDNALDGTIIDLRLVGQTDPGTIRTDELLPLSAGDVPSGARFRGGWYDSPDFTQSVRPYAIIPDNRFGESVASMPDLGNGNNPAQRDGQPELLISAPSAARGRGTIWLIYGQDFRSFRGQEVSSIPALRTDNDRSLVVPTDCIFDGAEIGDELGFASAAGDFNSDGNQDILAGAPGADRDDLIDNGIVYIFFGRLDFGRFYDLATTNPPRVEIHGTRSGDEFGKMQTIVGDINQDGLPDIGFASALAGGDGPGGDESGFIGIVFGGRRLTGENFLTVDQVATAQLPGVRIYGAQMGGHAGASINNAGDFNGDGIDDLLIVAPDETRLMGGTQRIGMAYVIFGGPHLSNQSFHLGEVGTSRLPGIAFVSPYEVGSADEAPINWAGPAGDVNADGFSDIMIGIETADFVNPLVPTQRRIDAGECYLIYGNNAGSNTVW